MLRIIFQFVRLDENSGTVWIILDFPFDNDIYINWQHNRHKNRERTLSNISIYIRNETENKWSDTKSMFSKKWEGVTESVPEIWQFWQSLQAGLKFEILKYWKISIPDSAVDILILRSTLIILVREISSKVC